MKKILLVACGSFNPITNMHLRLFELARDALQKAQPCQVVGVISPVGDGYSKKGLASAADRIAMIRLALASSDWIQLNTWEAEKDEWLETVYVLRHIEEIADSYFAGATGENGRSFEMQNGDDVNGNHDPSEVEVRLLCGADLLRSFTVPGVWKTSHMEEILRDFGVTVCTRSGCDLAKTIDEFDLLKRYEENLLLVTEWIPNEISSTRIREAVEKGESVKYLLQDPVIEYIRIRRLYRKITTQ